MVNEPDSRPNGDHRQPIGVRICHVELRRYGQLAMRIDIAPGLADTHRAVAVDEHARLIELRLYRHLARPVDVADLAVYVYRVQPSRVRADSGGDYEHNQRKQADQRHQQYQVLFADSP